MNLIRLTDAERNEWEAVSRSAAESGFMQSWAWSEFKRAEGQQVVRLGVYDAGRLIGGVIAYYVTSSLGPSPLEMPHGPVLPWNDPEKAERAMALIVDELAAVARATGATQARFEPLIEGPLPACVGHTTRAIRAPVDLIPTPTVLVSLRGSREEILSSMTPKGRYNIGKAARNGVTVASSAAPEAVKGFYPLFELTFNRHDFPGEPAGFFAHLMEHLGPAGMARVYTASWRGIALSSAVAVFYGEKATYLYGGTSPFVPSSMASYALHWQIMQDAKAAGCATYDLYGIAPGDRPDHPYARFSQFKSRFGGRVVTTAGAHDIYFYPQLAARWAENLKAIERRPRP